jgi:hypothetical protein
MAGILFVLRYQLIPYFAAHPIDQGSTWILFDKWQLGGVRLLNFAALGVLFALFRPYLARWLVRTPLVLLGKSSLEAFCVHVLFCFAALALVGDGTRAPMSYQVAIVMVTLSGMCATAYLRARPKDQYAPARAIAAQPSPCAAGPFAGAGRFYRNRPKFLSRTLSLFLFLFTVFLR